MSDVLTDKHIEVIQMCADGESYKSIAYKLGLADQGVISRANKAMRILGANNITNLVAIAFRKKLIK